MPLESLGAFAAALPRRREVVAYCRGPYCVYADDAVRLLGDQITAPVRWVETIRAMAARWPEARWIEIGPGQVLGGLLRKIVPGATCTALGTAQEIDTFLTS